VCLDQQKLRALYHRAQRFRIGAGEKVVLPAPAPGGKVARFAQGIAKFGMARIAAAPGNARAAFTQRNHLECARLHHRIGIRPGIDDCALPGKDRIRRATRNHRASDPVGAAHLDVLRGRIDRGGNIERGVEARLAGTRVIAVAYGANIEQAKVSNRSDEAGGYPEPGAVDYRQGGIGLHVCPHGGYLASAYDYRCAFHRCAAVTSGDVGIGNGKILCLGWGGRERHCGSGKCKEAVHFTSPSPCWPSSKSLTGRCLGSSASNINAPSTQTFSGRE